VFAKTDDFIFSLTICDSISLYLERYQFSWVNIFYNSKPLKDTQNYSVYFYIDVNSINIFFYMLLVMSVFKFDLKLIETSMTEHKANHFWRGAQSNERRSFFSSLSEVAEKRMRGEMCVE
jgi:hypothetical protein